MRISRHVLIYIHLILGVYTNAFSQTKIVSIKKKNNELLTKLQTLIQNDGSFKEAVFLSEQGFQNKVTVFNYYYDFITIEASLVNKYYLLSRTKKYKSADSVNYLKNLALYGIFSKSMYLLKDSSVFTQHRFRYNFDDPQGDKDFSSTFVTRLLATHYGNCRSFTYLYKILADELGAKCWLSLAPNHIYIRNYSKQVGWYNTELTSGMFPTDAWIAASGYVSPDAIRNGLYMDTLSNQQAIGLCILDLIQGYIRQTNDYTDGFVLKGCDLVLKYHAVNPMALLLKAEALKQLYLKKKDNSDLALTTFNEMEGVYAQLIKLGYREMPRKVYLKWLTSLSKEKEKFQNWQLQPNTIPADKINGNHVQKPIKMF